MARTQASQNEALLRKLRADGSALAKLAATVIERQGVMIEEMERALTRASEKIVKLKRDNGTR